MKQGIARSDSALRVVGAVTAERIDHAVDTVARMMVQHDMPQLIVTIRHLEAEREKLQEVTSAMDYAKEIVRRSGRNKGHNIESALLT